jgi:tripartite-type tricarboxylate transporter receptor subunit TctC
VHRRALVCALAIATIAGAGSAHAQPWPEKQPIRIIVPAGAGGPNDVLARLVAQQLQPALKQTVVVENRPGAGGAIGARAVATAAPDGYTLLIGNTATLAVIPAVSRKPGYDAAKNFAAVGKLIDAEQLLVVSAKLPAYSVPELIAYAKANPGKLNFSSGGVGNLTHLSGELFKLQAGIDIAHVPYKSDAESATAVVGGQVQMSFSNTALMQPLIREGKLRPLGVTSPKRRPEVPDVPAIAESLPGFAVTSFFGVVAPAGTPRAILDRVNGVLNDGLEGGEMRNALLRLRWTPAPSSPQDFGAFITVEQMKWRTIAEKANIRID